MNLINRTLLIALSTSLSMTSAFASRVIECHSPVLNVNGINEIHLHLDLPPTSENTDLPGLARFKRAAGKSAWSKPTYATSISRNAKEEVLSWHEQVTVLASAEKLDLELVKKNPNLRENAQWVLRTSRNIPICDDEGTCGETDQTILGEAVIICTDSYDEIRPNPNAQRERCSKDSDHCDLR